MRFTALPQVDESFLSVEKHQAGPGAQTGALAIHLHQRGLRLHLSTDTEQPPAGWRGEPPMLEALVMNLRAEPVKNTFSVFSPVCFAPSSLLPL